MEEIQQVSLDMTAILLVLALVVVLFVIFIFILKKTLGVRDIAERLDELNRTLEENNEKLKELIEDVNTRKERQAEQQRMRF
ncbi:MAG: hypothetical protein LBQ97_02800 [Fusobacteriaceae bacterium]|jgi:predicted PurR-regulated permease PerM|nr:hypothetical protein [Fusobacteriaceae bacterium]